MPISSVRAGGASRLTQTAKQLAEPRPEDLSGVDLAAYRELDRRWQDWAAVGMAADG
jgi:hypothetical protein